jgi:hypothetical protein
MPFTSADVEPWELHSELVLVSPEVCRRAQELLPERDPDAFLVKLRQTPIAAPISIDEREVGPALPVALASYGLWRVGQTARPALLALGLVVALASLAELLH